MSNVTSWSVLQNVVTFSLENKCDWICKKESCTHNYKYLEIQFWNIQLIIYLKNARSSLCAFLH